MTHVIPFPHRKPYEAISIPSEVLVAQTEPIERPSNRRCPTFAYNLGDKVFVRTHVATLEGTVVGRLRCTPTLYDVRTEHGTYFSNAAYLICARDVL